MPTTLSEVELRYDVEDIFARFLNKVEEEEIIRMGNSSSAPRVFTLKAMSANTFHNALIIASRELADKIIERVLKGTR